MMSWPIEPAPSTCSSEVALNRSASQSRWAGAFLLTGTLEERRGGQELKWNVSNRLTVREWPGQGAVADSSQITLDQTMSGRYDFTQANVTQIHL